MKTVIKRLSVILAVVYLLFLFVGKIPNPLEWDGGTRFIFVLVSLMTWFFDFFIWDGAVVIYKENSETVGSDYFPALINRGEDTTIRKGDWYFYDVNAKKQKVIQGFASQIKHHRGI